ncbi:MAG: hypothetical protein F4Y28_02300 [Acidimicrobiia bacterium]|nr:hypothetical protein [Acidimicrobiia bacterium]MYJ31755.1 hypothetical protein [Acidimicrobiia bacterium]
MSGPWRGSLSAWSEAVVSGVVVERGPDGTSLSFVSGGISVSVLLTPKQVDELVTKLVGRAESQERKPGGMSDAGPPRVRRRAERMDRGAAAVLPLINGGVLRVGEVLSMRSGGTEYSAVIREDGSFDIDGHVERSPTEAATYAAQAPRSGWRIWVNAAGESLEDLRWRLRGSEFRDAEGAESNTVRQWVDFCIRKRLRPGMERPGTIAAFFSDSAAEDLDEARAALAQWFAWCADQKWSRAA